MDLPAGRLSLDGRFVELRPKTWEVLRALVARPGDLVTKNELLDLVWPETAVTEGTLNKSIGELRAALDDSREAPRCIETVPRRGFRWIGQARVVEATDVEVADLGRAAAAPPQEPVTAPPPLVARSRELALLEAALGRARAGRRQVVFVTGEAGAGKTTLVDHFLQYVTAAGTLVAHGQCLETAGLHEPYLPLLDAFTRLAGDPGCGHEVATTFRRCAPAWVAQMPTLTAPGGEASAAPAPGSMLRELVTAVDEVARDRLLVVVVEDAHWADLATTDACAALARRRDPARLLLVVTMRGAEAMLSDHPIVAVRRDLVPRQVAEEIVLVPFADDEAKAYVASRCPGLEHSRDTMEWLQQQTAGNPLFVRLVLDEWIARRLVAADDDGAWSLRGDAEQMRSTVPDSLRDLLERQFARLGAAERALLEAASVRVGAFTAASVAAAAGVDPDDAEELCESIVRRGRLLRDAGEAVGADGRFADQVAFLHASVQNVVAAGLTSSRRRRLHLAAAEQLEKENAGRTVSVAALLAFHYEAAGDVARAVSHHLAAAKLAMHRDAPRDAIAMLEGALALIDANPDLPGPAAERIVVLKYLSHARQLAFGFVESQVSELWSLTSDLATATENFQERIVADAGRIVAGCVAGRYAESEEVVRAALPFVERVSDPGTIKTFLFAAGTLRYRMAMMADSCAMFDRALAIPHEGDPLPGSDLDALLMSQYSPAVALSGRADEVRRLAEVSLARAKAHSQYCECVTAALLSWALVLLRDHEVATPIAERTYEIAEACGLTTWSRRALVILGLSSMGSGRIDEGIAQMRIGLAGCREEGQICDHSAMLCLFAEALLDAGREGAGDCLREAAEVAAEIGELYSESEIHRLKARILRADGATVADLEPLLRRAIDLAQLRGIAWHALLSASDLADLLLDEGRGVEARPMLASALAAVAGGESLAAVVRARDLLARCEAAAA